MRVLPTAADLGGAVAAALAARLRDLVAGLGADDVVDLAVSGGFVATGVLARVDPVGIDWSRVRVWWVDERFVPAGDPGRNDEEAARLLFADAGAADLHPMPADAGQGLEAARASFEEEWTGTMGGRSLDLVVAGTGPDGHVASLFPGHAAVDLPGPVVAEDHSPKPPAMRLSLALPVLAHAREVWVVTAGEAKADAVAGALGGTRAEPSPVGRLRGAHTVWWLDRAAAGGLTGANPEVRTD